MKRLIIIYVLIILAVGAYAQNELHFSHIGREKGFPIDKANTITQDKNGFIWVGTWNGLSKFDGYTCVNYLPQYHDTTSISNREIIKLLTDSDGDVWAGTSNGLNHINVETNKITIFPFNSRIVSLCEDWEKHMWVGTLNNGIYKLNTLTKEITGFLAHQTINDIHIDPQHNIWVATHSGLVLLDEKNRNHKRYRHNPNQDSPSSSSIMQVVSSNNGYLWLATWGGGLNRVELSNDGSLKNFTHYLPSAKHGSICGDVIYRLLYDRFNNLWVGSWDKGLCLLKPDQQELPSSEAVFQTYLNDPLNQNSIASNDISSIFVDKDGLLWVGAGKIDRSQIIESGLERYALPKLSNNRSLHIKCFAKRGNQLWIGADQHLLQYEMVNNSYVFKKQYTPTNHTLKSKWHTPCFVLDIHPSDKGLWIGTEGAGLIFYPFNKDKTLNEDAAKSYRTNTKVALPENRICKILPSTTQPNTLWIGTMEGGFARLSVNNDKITKAESFNSSDGLSNNSIRTMLEDKHGKLWIGTQNGLNCFDYTKKIFNRYFYSTINANSINDNIVNSLFEDSDDNLWIGTNSGLNKKIHRNGETTFKGYPETDYLRNELIFAIKEDNNRNLWIRTYSGMIKFNINTEEVKDKFFGIDFENTRLERNSDIELNKNSFILGNNANFIIFDPNKITSKFDSTKVTITNIRLLNSTFEESRGKTTAELEKIKLSFNERMIIFVFSAMNYLSPNNITYYYKLDGFDTEWNTTKGKNSATYTNIPPGEYTFKVCTSHSSANITDLSITITPPLWQTTWAYITYFILTFLVAFFTFRLVKSRAKEKQKLAADKARAEELEALNEQKSLFFTDITHELRTPLTLILEPLKELIKDNSLNSFTKDKVSLIKNSSDKLLRLVNKLMEFRKIEAGASTGLNYQHVNVNQMLEEIFIFFQPMATSRKINFNIQYKAEETLAKIDIDKVEKVFFNLISNAFKYTQNEGEVSIIVDKNKDENIIVDVIDNGIGIDQEHHEKIFEQFFQVNQIQTQSTGGIGLYMVKAIIEMHKGKVSLTSKPKEGSHFNIILPSNLNQDSTIEVVEYRLRENQGLTIENEEKTIKKQGKLLNILIVEDDLDLNHFICEKLSADFNVKKALNGKEALEILEDYAADLILTDVLMPEMDGFELVRNLQKNSKFREIPTIFLTAKILAEDEAKGLKLGAVDYISKPFDINSLRFKINNLLKTCKKAKEQILTEQILQAEHIELPSENENFLKAAAKAVHNNLDNLDYDVITFSNDLRLSPNQTYKRLKSLTGQTTNEFIRSQRLKAAADLLSQKQNSVSEVMFMVGFSNASYFTRCFRKKYGCTPKDYIKLH